MSPRRCTTLPIRVLSTALLPRRSLSASISCRWRSSNSTLKNCDDWASRIFDIWPSCLEWSSNKLERSYTNFSGLQETIENTLFHDDVNSGNAPLRRLFERRITNTSFNSIQFKGSGRGLGRVRLFVGNRGSGRVGSTFRRVGSSRVQEK